MTALPRRRRTGWAGLAVLPTLALTMAGGFAQAAPPGADADTGPVRFVGPDFGIGGGTLPQHLVSADFNGDGDLDVAVANQGPTPLFGIGVGVALGDGAGHLADAVTTDLGSGLGACDLASGDWDDDDLADLVVVGCTTGGKSSLIVLTSNGDGTFTKRQSPDNTADVQLVAGDLNGDGFEDFVASAHGSAVVKSYLSKGDGTFKPPVVKMPSFDSYDLEIAYVDGDADLDLIGAAGGPIWTMLGNGDGTFGNQLFHGSSVLTGIELAVADFDGDAKVDVAVVDASGGHVGVGLGSGTGTFLDGDQITLGTRQAVWVTAGSIDKDGKADLVAGLDNDSTASALLRGKGNGHFRKASHWIVGTNGLEVGDLDADGRDDLLSFVDDRVYGTLGTRKGFEAAKLKRGPLSEDLVDLDNDGVLDKITGATGFEDGQIKSVIIGQLGKGNGKFGKQITSLVRVESASSGVGDIAVGDINEDGKLDVVGGFDNFQVSVNNLWWSLGKGNGKFGSATLSMSGDFHADILGVGLDDVNGDDHLDIVSHDLTSLTVKLGAGDGTFGAPIASGVGGPGQRDVLLADLTGDGDLDAVTIVKTGGEDFGSGEIRLQQGHGDGTFTLVQTRGVQSNLTNGTIADLNHDTRPDVVTAGSRGFNGGINAMYVLLTTAGGQLGAPMTYAGPVGQVRTADVDLDGDPDIATSGNAKIDFYLNNGNGVFPVIDDVLAGGGLGTLGDLDGDGDPDMLSGTPFGEFAVHLNAKG